MKKFISVLLVAIMMFSFMAPASAFEMPKSKVPIIEISGDGSPIHDKDDKKIFQFMDILRGIRNEGEDGEDSDNSELYKSIANVMYPFIVEGLLTDNWDNYYKNLQKEISELFADALLDNNGEASNGTGISGWAKWNVDYKAHHDMKIERNRDYYQLDDYEFYYDWRLDPLQTADIFNDYIKNVKKVTGSEKVAIVSRCLGTNVCLAYIAKYGTDDICGIGFDGTVVNGAESISEPISGKLKVDGNAINRFLADCNGFGMFSVDEFINATIDLLTKGGILDGIVGFTRQTLYEKLLEGVTSALALSTLFTWPNYWAGVTSEDYGAAMNYVFGKEESEKRQEYAGLIEKIENYDKTVRQHIPELMKKIDKDCNLCVISKYGSQIAPVCESRDAIADQIASVKRTSFGATTSTVYGTLSDSYIDKRVAEGKGKYIAPDRQIDASTCMFPDYTWFIKGARHSEWTEAENYLLTSVVSADKQLTVDDFELTQFFVYDNETKTASPMNDENYDTYFWHANERDDKPQSNFDRLFAFIKSVLTWLLESATKIFAKKAA